MELKNLLISLLNVFEVAKSIGSGLAKATLAGKVNGELVDAAHVIDTDSSVR
jgi:threonyl-tRNA synthetase (EC 6.1.1.3)/Ser-tRNA(Thr) hydrolase (EC 3.1.1.-)